MRSNLLYAIAAIAALAAFDARAEELKLASWNIGNLASKPGVPLRGHARDEAEYQHIRDIFAKLEPDIITLQEMGSMGSARAVVGDSYNIVFEERCMTNSALCNEDVDDIFTAIAYKKSLGQLAEVQVPQLSVMHTSECANETPRPVRGGVGVELQRGNTKVVVVSVHLKASCKRNDNENERDQADDCATLMKQADILSEWIRTERAAGKQVIVAGDFNRQLLDSGDHVAAKFRAVDPGVQFFPTARQCWASFPNRGSAIIAAANQKFPEIAAAGGRPLPYSPKSNSKIDYFLVSGPAQQTPISSEQYAMGSEAKTTELATDYLKTCEGKPNKFEDGSVLTFSEVEPSDHCPISMTLP
ncbi:endonuclease/exonuclease/phosphatase family metal-dependent hydrolase [Rhizobium sp. BK226]|uniref:endonuclease/exonuclease/phosphatase family protein n=1 Tax=Rhizobium sp. BK226 TaxID=2587075 RepID=UPI0016216551|nr:endonuclease/exonuclease/phosphatase family protein [Rhizobium sp. BK226]MBB4113249.1 endonuclease/exonuclease/phosphatase family metal-dependent hydrolase [Rhizobium sp. BK226]